jgi:hypothetical protein
MPKTTDRWRPAGPFKFSEQLFADVDRFLGELRSEHPGVSYTRADAVRVLLEMGLAHSNCQWTPEQKEVPKPKRRRKKRSKDQK